jgi:hypothetical protein
LIVITHTTLDPSVHGVGLPTVEGVEGVEGVAVRVAVPVTMGEDSTYEEDSSTPELVCKKKSCKSGTAVSKCKIKLCKKSSCVTCFKGMLKQHKLAWNRDGPKGASDPINSESNLMKWLLEEGNYNKYCACIGGMTKERFAEQIVDQIKEAGILSKRDDKQHSIGRRRPPVKASKTAIH